jgi:hypothetical protein
MAASPDTLAGRFKDDALLHQFRSNMAADERKHGKGSRLGASFSGRTNVRASSSSHSSRKERSPDNKAESSVGPRFPDWRLYRAEPGGSFGSDRRYARIALTSPGVRVASKCGISGFTPRSMCQIRSRSSSA